MASDNSAPDLTQGVALADIPEGGLLAGTVGDTDVMLARFTDDAGREQVTALDATCTHSGAALPNGLREGNLVRCPFHHACFDLRTGEALVAPAYESLRQWDVQIADGTVTVADPGAPGPFERVENTRGVRRVVVVGGGAAGFATVERLRRCGYEGELTMVSGEPDVPLDRTKLSKAYLSGGAEADALALLDESWYAEHDVALRLSATATALNLAERSVTLSDGSELTWDALVLATGAEPKRLDGPGFDRPDAYVLRTKADADRLIAAAGELRRLVVIGSGFIGLETAAAMRDRDVEVTVVSGEEIPLQSVLGSDLGTLIKGVHTEHGVRFVTGAAASWDGTVLTLEDGSTISADGVVMGIGVSPRTELAEAAGLQVDDGVIVDAMGETAHRGVFAAGDVARFPGPLTGRMMRVEHWAQAQRAGATAAINLLGGEQPMSEPPFFWSKHWSTNIRYTGHALSVEDTEVDGSLADASAVIRYSEEGRVTALASVGRDLELLELEDELLRL